MNLFAKVLIFSQISGILSDFFWNGNKKIVVWITNKIFLFQKLFVPLQFKFIQFII
jgi:hypothetical protein